MTRMLSRWGVYALLLSGSVAQEVAEPQAASPAEPTVEVAPQGGALPVAGIVDVTRAVQGLMSPDYTVREAASLYLWRHGELAALQPLLDHADPEVRYRVRTIVQNLQYGLTPETSPEIMALAQEFLTAGYERKRGIANALRDKKAYIQLFALKNALSLEHREGGLRRDIERASGHALQALMQEDRTEDALTLLQYAGPGAENARWWAMLQGRLGQAEEVLATALRAEAEELPHRAERVLALYRHLGRDEEALRWAQEMQMEEYIAGQALLRGEMEGFLEWWLRAFAPDAYSEAYLSALRHRVAGQQEAEQQAVRALQQNAKKDENARVLSIIELTAAGAGRKGQSLLSDEERRENTTYLTERGDYRELLALYDLKLGQTVSEEWIHKHMGGDNEEWRMTSYDSEDELSQLFASLRDWDSLLRILRPHWEYYLASGEAPFTFLDQYYSAGYHVPVMQLFRETMTEEEQEEVILSIPMADQLAGAFDALIAAEFPALGHAERLEFVLEVRTGAVKSEAKLERIGVLASALEQSSPENAHQEAERQSQLLYLYQLMGRHQEILAHLEEDYQAEPSTDKARTLIPYYFRFDRPQEAGQLALTVDNTGQKNAFTLDLIKAHSLFKGGLQQEGEALLSGLEERFMDQPSHYRLSMLYIGADGERDHEHRLMSRGLALTNPSETNFYFWESFLRTYMQQALDAGDPHSAALAGEVLLLKELKDARQMPNGETFQQHELVATLARLRFQTDLAWIAHWHKTGAVDQARQLAGQVAAEWIGSGLMADDFYPLLLSIGMGDIAAASARQSFARYEALVAAYPTVYNHMNTAAWITSRALVQLEKSSQWMDEVLRHHPVSAAYLDTRAELFFAQGNRARAVEYSTRAWQRSQLSGGAEMIKEQYERFLNAPLPAQQ